MGKTWHVTVIEKTQWLFTIQTDDFLDAEEQALALFDKGYGDRGETFISVSESETVEASGEGSE